MKNSNCDKTQDYICLASVGELDNSEYKVMQEHLEHCQACREYSRVTHSMLQSFKQEDIELPNDKEWGAMSDSAYTDWQSQQSEPDANTLLASSISSVLKLKNTIKDLLFNNHYYSIYAGSAATLICVLFLTFKNDKIDPPNNADFLETYTKNTTGKLVPVNIRRNDGNVFSFNQQHITNHFTIGVYLSQTLQTCYFDVSSACDKSLEKFVFLSSEYSALLEQNMKPAADILKAFDAAMHHQLRSKPNEYFLYQLGAWSANMLFASQNQLDGIQAELPYIQYAREYAQTMQLAVKVIIALELLEERLLQQSLDNKDYSAIESSLSTMNEILL